MTDKQCLKKCKELIRNAMLVDECERLTKSGGINVSEQDKESYIVPRVIVSTAMKNVSDKLAFNKDMEKMQKNLLCF